MLYKTLKFFEFWSFTKNRYMMHGQQNVKLDRRCFPSDAFDMHKLSF